jgi:hypothetical protein
MQQRPSAAAGPGPPPEGASTAAAPPEHLASLLRVCAALSGSGAAAAGAAADLSALGPEAALQVLLAWASQARALRPATVAAAAPAVEALLPALRRGAAGGFNRQQVADAAWGLAHFEARSAGAWDGSSSGGSGGSSSSSSSSSQGARARCSEAGEASSSGRDGSGGSGSNPAPGRAWSAEFEEAMQVPFRVLPNALPGADLEGFWEELRPLLRRDVIWLDGGARSVEVGAPAGAAVDRALGRARGRRARGRPGAAAGRRASWTLDRGALPFWRAANATRPR